MGSAQKPVNPLLGEGTKTVTLPRAREGQEKFLFVAVNGVGFRIEKGVPVEVPLSVAEVIENADKAEAENEAFLAANWDKK